MSGSVVNLGTNVLYSGGNLDIIRGHIPDESANLHYLDLLFNRQQQSTVLSRNKVWHTLNSPDTSLLELLRLGHHSRIQLFQ